MIKLHQIVFANKGRRINYEYEVSTSVQKFFDKKQLFYSSYGIDVSTTPESIAVIPFLSNIMPIAWFVGFDVHVPEIDETFYNSLLELKEVFIKYYPDKKLKGDIIPQKIIFNKIAGKETCLLFSGGLDSFESYTRNYGLNPYLISIHGADVAISDAKRWTDFKKYNDEEDIVKNDRLFYIETNVRDFYTYKIEFLINGVGWWGKIQHGMSLIGAIAPLSNQLNLNKIIIASSRTKEVDVGWGSSPIVDEKMKWADSSVVHDGFHLKRTDKIDNVISYATKNNTTINLRVCYSEYRDGYNCNVCAKCLRTIFGIILSGSNPNDFGFKVPPNLYDMIYENLEHSNVVNEGGKYHWECLQDKALMNPNFFVLNNRKIEEQAIRSFAKLNLGKILKIISDSPKKNQKLKLILRNKYSGMYKMYLAMRHKKYN